VGEGVRGGEEGRNRVRVGNKKKASLVTGGSTWAEETWKRCEQRDNESNRTCDCRYHYYTQLHILTVFLALGVGADDVFVYFDCWRQSAEGSVARTILGRINYALSRAWVSCLNTTFTTVRPQHETQIGRALYLVLSSKPCLVRYRVPDE
jgi:hypothetical protein